MDSDQTLQQIFDNDEPLPDWVPTSSQPFTVVDEPEVTPKTLPSANQFHLPLWVRVLWQYPIVFWSGIWVLLLVVMGIAVVGLMSPELSKRPELPTPDIANRPAALPEMALDDVAVDDVAVEEIATEADEQALPIWALGTIVLSCVAGSLLISQRLQHTRQERRSLETSSKRTLPLLNPTWQKEDDSEQPLPTLVSTLPPNATPLPPTPTLPSPSVGEIIRSAAQPLVTIVPSDESTLLDWEDAGLAELMDIRYRRQR